MREVLFEIPGLGLPVYGYGFMLVIALFLSTWVAARIAAQNGGDAESIYDLSTGLFLSGIFGARLFFFLQYWNRFDHWYEFFFIWRGGLVVYGGALGALVFLLVYAGWKRLPRLWLLDVITPSMALGLAIGRLGCMLNGCCYGDFCDSALGVRFPPGSPPHVRMIKDGYQSRLGFIVVPQDRRVLFVEPGSDAEKKGLLVGDQIVAVDGKRIETALQWTMAETNPLMADQSSRALQPFTLDLVRDGKPLSLTVQQSWTLPIHPTQLYSSVDGLVLFLLLLAYYPFRRHDGEVISLFAMLYAVTRFLIEYLRYDELPILWGMTISQVVSIPMFLSGVVLWLYLRRLPNQYQAKPDSLAEGSSQNADFRVASPLSESSHR